MVLGGGRQLPVGKKTALGKGGQERRGRRTVGMEWSVWTLQSTESKALIPLITIMPLSM